MHNEITKDETRKRKSPERNRKSVPKGESILDKKKLKLPCSVCSETFYSNLLGCSQLKKYLPGQPEGTNILPKRVCKLCLGTIFTIACHIIRITYAKF